MDEERRNSADDIESGLDNGVNAVNDAASMMRGQIPSRPSKPSPSSAASGAGKGSPPAGGTKADRGNIPDGAGTKNSPLDPGAPGTPGKPGGPGATGGSGGPDTPGGTGGPQGHNPDATNRPDQKQGADGSRSHDGNSQSVGKNGLDGKGTAPDSPRLDTPQAPPGSTQPTSTNTASGQAAGNNASSRDAAQPQNSASGSGRGPDQASKSGGGAKGGKGDTGASGKSSAMGKGTPGASEAAPQAGGAAAEGATGTGSSGAAAGGTGGGSAAGAGAGSAASAGGSAAASGGAAAGGAASGAATGAAVGTAAGPIGTVVGAAAGMILPKLIKLVLRIALIVVFFVAIFMMHPSLLYDNPMATSDRTTLEDTYNWYYDSIESEYRKDILRAMQSAESKASDYDDELQDDPTTLLDGVAKLTDEEATAVQTALDELEADVLYDIEWESEVLFLRSVDEYLEAVSTNINYVISFMDLQKKNWFHQLWDYIMNSLTGGWYSNFIDAVDVWWTGIWQDFVLETLYSVSATVEYDTIEVEGDDDEVTEELIAIITVKYTFDIRDKGIGYYAGKMELDSDDLDRGTEMAFYLGDLFGTLNGEYIGWYITPGFHDEEYSGGGTAANIKKALADMEEELEGLHYDPNGPHVFPLQGYTNPPTSCPYGPRPYFTDDPFHTGIDFAPPYGTPIVAVADGVVLFRVQANTGFGNRVIVYHGDNVATLYAHMSSFGSYGRGDTVRAGDVIGYVGRSGLSTGDHLHFQLHVGPNFDVRNPVGFFDFLDYLLP